MIGMMSVHGGRGRPILSGSWDLDRLPWFVCKKPELNTKSPSGLYAVRSAFSRGRRGRGRPKLWSGRGRTGRLETHFFKQNSWIYFFRGWSPTRDEKFVAKFRKGGPRGTSRWKMGCL